MRNFLSRLPPFLLMAIALDSTAVETSSARVDYIAVEPGRNWNLVGEWDLPSENGHSFPNHYTFSILKKDGSYALAWTGDLIGGCCTWPLAAPLNQLSDTKFTSKIDGTEYEIASNASLIVRYIDGRVHHLSTTPENIRFSSQWK